MRNFVKIKFSRNGEITMSFVNMAKSCPSHEFLIANMSYNPIYENFQIYSTMNY